MIYTIVILHFNTLDFTIGCVESILELKIPDDSMLNIVIVDNGSTDISIGEIESKYNLLDNIYIIKNENNLGFAKGNNMGYKFAKNELGSDFIILSNSDVVIQQKNFLINLDYFFSEYNFGVLGPDVFNPITKNHQSPLFFGEKIDLPYVEKRKKRIKFKKNFLLYFPLFSFLLKDIENILARRKSIKREQISLMENCCIHGSFIIFSKLYIRKFDEGLFPDTFMYCEEDILQYLCQREKIPILYNKGFQILHFEGKSTSMLYNKYIEKQIYKNNEIEKSLKVLENLIVKDNQ